MNAILSVRELTDALRRKVEGAFPFVWVKGEVTNLSRPSSGHLYFSLKDADALLNCVWFRGQQRPAEKFDPLTGEVFADGPRRSMAQGLENGQQLLCAGRVSVYAPRGSYQLIVELVQEAGLGQLHAAFELRKAALAARGFFALERKRPLPYNPTRVALITAPTGAAVQDFIRLASDRGGGAEIRLYPVLVQGEGAAPSLVRALQAAQDDSWAQVIVVIRGGGSLEDLWAFNEECVAEAVFASQLPVLAGIGHEVDISMCDMTADARAATPSHAAQLLWPSRASLVQQIDSLECALQDSMQALVCHGATRLASHEQALGWLSPLRALSRLEDSFTARHERLMLAFTRFMDARRLHVSHLAARMAAAFGLEKTYPKADMLAQLSQRLTRSMDVLVQQQCAQLEQISTRLEALSPLAPLERGYALVHDSAGQLVRSVAQSPPGSTVTVRVSDGSLDVSVNSVNKIG
ncbi:MAG: exodeoxyribonuclease VII large subunit [Desulfovibrionaceae bacterium]